MVASDAGRLAGSAHLGERYADAALGEIHRQAEPDGTSPDDQDLGGDVMRHGSNCHRRFIVVLGESAIKPDCAISGHNTHKFAEGGRRPLERMYAVSVNLLRVEARHE